jgi:hypothetical protein|tara:strand:- start:78 stop:527 length:450 start_codon:yes stop_codon:yes gene_type:complete
MIEVFEKDLAVGVEQERRILKQIKSKYPKTYKIEGYYKEWDIFIPEKNFGVEVKYDKKSQETGNIVIEVEFDGKPSALQTTKAEYWIIFDGKDDVWIKPGRIEDCIIQNGLRYAEFTGRGDRHSKKAFLIKKEVLYPYADKIITNSLQS